MVLPILVMLLLLGIDLGRIFFTTIDLRNAAHEASMLGAVEPDSECADMQAIVDQQMGRDDPSEASVCPGPLPTGVSERTYITSFGCQREDPGPSCDPWSPNYPPDADLRYAVRLEYRFQPVVPFVGLLTGNGMGGSIPVSVENLTPVLVGYEGA